MIFGNRFTQTTYLTLAAALLGVTFAFLDRWPQITMTFLFVAGISLIVAAPVFLRHPKEARSSARHFDQFRGSGKLALAVGTGMIVVFLAAFYK